MSTHDYTHTHTHADAHADAVLHTYFFSHTVTPAYEHKCTTYANAHAIVHKHYLFP